MEEIGRRWRGDSHAHQDRLSTRVVAGIKRVIATEENALMLKCTQHVRKGIHAAGLLRHAYTCCGAMSEALHGHGS